MATATLSIERAGRSAHEADGNENGHEDDGRGHQCRCQSAHGLDRSLIGGAATLVEACLDGFDNDDAVVDHRTDDQHEGEKRQQIEAEANGVEESECSEQRDDDGQRGDERCAQVVEKEIDHEHDEQNGDDERLDDVGDGGVEEVFRARDVGQHHALRQRGGKVSLNAVHLLDGLVGV